MKAADEKGAHDAQQASGAGRQLRVGGRPHRLRGRPVRRAAPVRGARPARLSTGGHVARKVGGVNRARTLVPADEAALRQLWDDHAGPLLGFVLRLTGGDRGRAEDVVQETLLQAWRHPEALDPARGPIRPWLLTVARRVVIDQYRARQARPEEVGDDGLADLAADDGIEAALDRWLVTDALA